MNERRLIWIEAGLSRWTRLVANAPRRSIAVLIGLAALGLALAASLLGVNADTTRMVSSKLDFRQAQFDFLETFPGLEDQIAVIVRAPTPDAADAYSTALVAGLSARGDIVEDVFAPQVDPFFVRNGLLYLDTAELDAVLARLSRTSGLIGRLGPDPSLGALYDALADAVAGVETGALDPDTLAPVFNSLAGTIEARLSGTPAPMSWQRLSNSAAAEPFFQSVVSVTPNVDRSQLRSGRRVVEAIQAEADAILADPRFVGLSVHLTGNLALRADELRSVSDGIGLSFGLSFIFVGVLLWLALRSPALVAVSLASLVISISITAGFAALAFGSLNLVSVAFTVLLVGLGIDFAIHFALHVQEARVSGVSAKTAMYRTHRAIGAALALSAPTSAVAFFSFSPTAFTGMAQLGAISGFGVLVAFAVAMTLLPAAFQFIGPVKREAMSPSRETSDRTERIRGGLAVSVLIAGAASLFLLPQVRFSADPMALRDPDAPTVQAFNLLFDDEDTRPYTLTVLEPDADRASEIADDLRRWPEVRRVTWIESFVPREQDDKLDAIDFASVGLSLAFADQGDPGVDASTATRRLLSALNDLQTEPSARLAAVVTTLQAVDDELRTAVQRDVFAFWPDLRSRLQKQMRADYVELDGLPASLTRRYVGVDGRYRLEVAPSEDLRDPSSLRRFVELVSRLEPRAAGSARSVYQSAAIISEAMLQAGVIALILVALILWLTLRDVVLVAVILFSLGLAGALTGAASVLIDMPFNFANVIVVPLLIGLGADSGIHLGLRARRAETASDVYATSTPRAVFFSALTTIASFGTLALSDHRGVASMGALLTISIAATLLCATLVQPWLLSKLQRR